VSAKVRRRRGPLQKPREALRSGWARMKEWNWNTLVDQGMVGMGEGDGGCEFWAKARFGLSKAMMLSRLKSVMLKLRGRLRDHVKI
jgi:hypothetical protein